ncbi:MAG: bifunctional UDP-N-acetylglucosamine diphosphorylase/glucosamine-1-phosphate N-acetyltransferase GlmU [Magnetococcales bacterium]|nr:bifunctional UDP-N-acetylglucosamine diphosphorylase/glucosamine-1-phosphate N-acetyltransferase GlmU [Magnetococcales bacterium]
MNRCSVLILAAGQGTRMRSQLPKVLHSLAGQPLLWHILRAVRGLQPDRLVVVTGFEAEQVERSLAAPDIHWVRQTERKGTGHAVRCALDDLRGLAGELLILNGDHPLVDTKTLQTLLDHHRTRHNLLTLLTTTLTNPAGYGRVVRDARGGLERIVEEKDANGAERGVNEINTGFYCVDLDHLPGWVERIANHNAQNEYYLPDIVPMALAEGRVDGLRVADGLSLSGVNDRAQLARLEAVFRDRMTARLMAEGVTFIDPGSCWLAADAVIGVDTVIEPQVMLGPGSVVGERCHIGPFCHMQASRVGPDCRILPYCHLDGVEIEGASEIGPYARLRPGTHLARKAKIGNFCEIKKSRIGAGSKVNHLSYIGDAEVGSGVNVGAGTITCNYDGVRKHQTVIEDNVFVGSDVQFVAPVRVGAGATIGAGTTVTKDVPASSLAVSRAPQAHISGWAARVQSKKAPS